MTEIVIEGQDDGPRELKFLGRRVFDRAGVISGIFNGARYLAMVGAVLTGTLVADLGGVKYAAAVFTPIYLIGIVAIAWLAETRGKPLPA